MISTYTMFAIGYFVRPLSGIIFAHYGDKYGRKVIFIITVFLMAVPTFLIGLLPAYQTIGTLAPLQLLLMRIYQELAVGGEIPGAATFVYEHSSNGNKFIGMGTLFSGLIGGVLMGSIVGALVSKNLSEIALESWGWRTPFFIGGFLGVVGTYLRRKVSETPIFLEIEKLRKIEKFSLKKVIKKHNHPIGYKNFVYKT